MCLCQGIDTRRLALAISGDTTETEALQVFFCEYDNIKENLTYIAGLQTRQVYGDKL
jgi:serine phosphatase RsbU (regulator of sigma subunit)